MQTLDLAIASHHMSPLILLSCATASRDLASVRSRMRQLTHELTLCNTKDYRGLLSLQLTEPDE